MLDAAKRPDGNGAGATLLFAPVSLVLGPVGGFAEA